MWEVESLKRKLGQSAEKNPKIVQKRCIFCVENLIFPLDPRKVQESKSCIASLKGPEFRIWSGSGPKCQNGPEKVRILVSWPGTILCHRILYWKLVITENFGRILKKYTRWVLWFLGHLESKLDVCPILVTKQYVGDMLIERAEPAHLHPTLAILMFASILNYKPFEMLQP